jgi:type IV secretory pathway VirB10-like protein
MVALACQREANEMSVSSPRDVPRSLPLADSRPLVTDNASRLCGACRSTHRCHRTRLHRRTFGSSKTHPYRRNANPDSTDLVARSPAPHETPAPWPSPLASVRAPAPHPSTIETGDRRSVALASQPAVPATAEEPAAPPTPSAAEIAYKRNAYANQAARDAPLVSAPSNAAPIAHATPDADGGYWLRRGMTIAATIYTSIDSTVPGVIVAYVADDGSANPRSILRVAISPSSYSRLVR